VPGARVIVEEALLGSVDDLEGGGGGWKCRLVRVHLSREQTKTKSNISYVI
jgi:hypothetical protein